MFFDAACGVALDKLRLRRSMMEGPLLSPKNPSTALRAVPLPEKSRRGIWTYFGAGRLALKVSTAFSWM